MRHKGVQAHRLTREPLEARFAMEWQHTNDNGRVLSHILDRTSGLRRPSDPTQRDVEVAATVIQWLGSNVGQAFIRDVMTGHEKAVAKTSGECSEWPVRTKRSTP